MDLRRALLTLALSGWPRWASACAVCFGTDDPGVKRAFNLGILFLGALVLLTLGGMTAMFLRAMNRQEGR